MKYRLWCLHYEGKTVGRLVVCCRLLRRVAMVGSDIQNTYIGHWRLPDQYPIFYCAQREKVVRYLVVEVKYKRSQNHRMALQFFPVPQAFGICIKPFHSRHSHPTNCACQFPKRN